MIGLPCIGIGRRSGSEYKLILASTGNGSGVSTLTLNVLSNIIITLDNNGYFYTNSAD